MTDRAIGQRRFVDGSKRQVFEDAHGRHYVFGNDRRQVYGQCLLPADEPVNIKHLHE